jgi:L,D-transpeptidase YcbB
MYTFRRILFLPFLFIFFSCNNKNEQQRTGPTPTTIDEASEQSIKDVIDVVLASNGKFNDGTQLYYPSLVEEFYTSKDNESVWSRKSSYTPLANTLHQFIEQSMNYGLFPEDYHYSLLKKLKGKLADSSNLNKTAILSQADLLYTDAFLRLAEHLKKGRLSKDSLTLTADTTLKESFYVGVLKEALKSQNIFKTLQDVEPKHKDYIALKAALPSFLQAMDVNRYTYVVYPNKDSIQFVKAITKRLYEGGILGDIPNRIDSGSLASAILKFQKAKGLKPTGRPSVDLVKAMNASDWYRFKRIAATLDRYKTLSATLPETYVWVNLPSYKLKVVDHDSIIMTSKVIIGKPTNKTPELNSEINNIVLYPTWSVPYSIAIKEMLPIAKRNPGYFAKRGFKVFNGRGKQVDPYSINWAKYGKSVPFSFRQNEGGGNALGIIKFNFENPYAVYLHDTNQRYLFDRDFRALSHGCVRVHLWDSMARYLISISKPYVSKYDYITKDSITAEGDTVSYTKAILRDSVVLVPDSLKSMMSKKKNTFLKMPKRIPIFIRYYGCEARDGKVVFFDDIYSEDKVVIDTYFSKR